MMMPEYDPAEHAPQTEPCPNCGEIHVEVPSGVVLDVAEGDVLTAASVLLGASRELLGVIYDMALVALVRQAIPDLRGDALSDVMNGLHDCLEGTSLAGHETIERIDAFLDDYRAKIGPSAKGSRDEGVH